jgi:hypothetical protein
MNETMSSVFRFEGLMVFHPNRSTTPMSWQVGILNATAEVLKTLHPKLPWSSMGGHDLVVKDHRTKRVLIEANPFSQDWYLDVIDDRGCARREIAGKSDSPSNRRNPNGDLQDIGWLINLKKEFHPDENLEMKRGALSPIIHLSNGRLYTSCKTDGIAYWRDSEVLEDYSFGFITETVALGIESCANETIVLRSGGKPVLKLPYRPQGYQIDIENVPTQAHMDQMVAMGMDETAHFQLYYELLFPNVKDRCYLEILQPSEQSPNLCGMAAAEKSDQGPFHMFSIPPYKCGGIICDDEGCWNP